MKILLSEEQLQHLLTELGDTNHVVQRLYERFNTGSMPVFIRRVIDKGHGMKDVNYLNVGEYIFSQDEMNDINDRINLLFSYDYRKSGSFAVEIRRFDIINRINQIKFNDEEGKTYWKDLAIANRSNLCFANFKDFFSGDLDKGSKAWGNGIALIIRQNNATTIFWGDSTKFDPGYFGTDYHIRKVETFVQKNSTNPSQVPDEIKKYIGQNKDSFSKPDENKPDGSIEGDNDEERP
jgi:hypothetical protein